MAASFFRGSCAIFWLTWLSSIAYVFGTGVYEHNYIIRTAQYDQATFYVRLSCYMIIALAFTGCIFVKCDISHISCFLLYNIPLFFVVPGLSIFGIVLTQGSFEVDPKFALKMLQESWKIENESPHWLVHTEFEDGCCGIYSWKDYYLNVYDEAAVPEIRIPDSCCKQVPQDNHHCFDENVASDFLVTKDKKNQTDFEDGRDTAFYGQYLNQPNFPYLNTKYLDLIYRNGCTEYLHKNLDSARAGHFTFSIIMIVLCLLMAIAYIKSWCSSRPFAGGRSDHSLDIETNSVLDLPQVEPMPSFLPKDSNFSIKVPEIGKGDMGGEPKTAPRINAVDPSRPSVTINPSHTGIPHAPNTAQISRPVIDVNVSQSRPTGVGRGNH